YTHRPGVLVSQRSRRSLVAATFSQPKKQPQQSARERRFDLASSITATAHPNIVRRIPRCALAAAIGAYLILAACFHASPARHLLKTHLLLSKHSRMERGPSISPALFAPCFAMCTLKQATFSRMYHNAR